MNNPFYANLKLTIEKNIWNNYQDNHDHYRFGPTKQNKSESETENQIRHACSSLAYYAKGAHRIIAESPLASYIEPINNFYHLLADDRSRDLIVQLVAYRILGQNKIKLPLSNPQYWQNIDKMKGCIQDPRDIIPLDFMDWQLNRINLSAYGLPIEMYFTPKGAYIEFILRSYEYIHNEVRIKVESGDTVIDGGACWGDTALLFSFQAGTSGRVHSFEFLPSNLNVLRCNVSLNRNLAKQINIVERPLWSASSQSMYYSNNGPGSQISFEKFSDNCDRIETISIDDYVQQNGIKKIDFIKMDIEGAEQNALKGALKTICKFRPKLAIAIYHNLDDFSRIAEFIHSLGLGYKFYIGHYTIHAEETILYAA